MSRILSVGFTKLRVQNLTLKIIWKNVRQLAGSIFNLRKLTICRILWMSRILTVMFTKLIAMFRNDLYDEDAEDKAGYRCKECAKWRYLAGKLQFLCVGPENNSLLRRVWWLILSWERWSWTIPSYRIQLSTYLVYILRILVSWSWRIWVLRRESWFRPLHSSIKIHGGWWWRWTLWWPWWGWLLIRWWPTSMRSLLKERTG